KTTIVQQPAQEQGSTGPSTPPPGTSPDKVAAAQQNPPPAAVRPTCFVPATFVCYVVRAKAPPADPGLPVTQFTVQITTVISGQAAANGQIVVTQPGGPIDLPTYPHGPKLHRIIEVGHDHLIKPGEEQVFFLSPAADGTYFVVGGPQGRFFVRD